ncbi:GNAT family N-acetyltransferase [Caldibacillus lycopersici]|uniref:GNAT family N-acetyltransferase n=1 Tax=Perspicuibacillus lycopersici TaxID=1325689 RepID=A0AAE3LP64_9BACI|nr:GNAT family N-acetyltransferase [Perspicuibacillus lycopersici]MCU9612024.1 GNAT family N-acetyltransferase [Perspicuibacillus lycopersici]
MYQYFHGLVIREGTEDIPPEKVKKLFEDVGWSRQDLPSWQIEKFRYILENSTWAFTVWDKEQMIGMVRVVSDKVMMATIMDLIVEENYREMGIGKKLVSLCLQKLPHGDWFAHTSANNFPFYEKCGFTINNLTKNGTCVYYGYIQARKDGHRIN